MRNDKLQLFAAPQNMTGRTQIAVTAREIDFVSSFARDLQSLLDIMGISNMIKKDNGTQLKKKSVSGTLQSGTVAEGDEIPYSQYAVTETNAGTITIKKYKRGVSLEAIAEKGYAAAVQATDDEFKADLQDVITSDFYTQLAAGTLTGSGATFQAAVAKAIGLVKNKFKQIHKTATGVAVFVNILDAYDYLGAAQITVQNAFGMDYIENFMGADVVFLCSEVTSGAVYATPFNNLNCYYVDPGDSEFAQAGLEYTTDAETGFIGFHTQGNYDRAISDNYALMGVSLFAEYQDGIANVSF